MNSLKQKLSDRSKMFELFFLIYKIAVVVSSFFVFRLAYDVFAVGYRSELFPVIGMVFSTLFFVSLQIAAAHFAEKMIKNDNIIGLVIGYALSLMCLVSILFPVGLFGLYSFLNGKFRNQYFVQNRPLWLSGLYEQIEKWTSPKQA